LVLEEDGMRRALVVALAALVVLAAACGGQPGQPKAKPQRGRAEHGRSSSGASGTPTVAPAVSVTPGPSGSAQPPASATDCPPTHPIKGEQSASGERVYHLASQKTYVHIRPVECFATEDDARAAGYRRSRR